MMGMKWLERQYIKNYQMIRIGSVIQSDQTIGDQNNKKVISAHLW